LSRGDLVAVELPAEEPPRELTPHFLELAVRYEDEFLMVIDKPAGLVVHPAPGHWSDTLVNALAARGTRLSTGAPGRPGIVHRLDKETSGLLIVAKTDEAHQALSRALAARRIERIYAAVVWGHIPQPLSIDAPIARHKVDRKRMAVLADGKPARTLVEPVARFDVCDLVRVRLETGRTHQVRVHLAHVGHPVIGDAVYGGGGARRVSGGQRGRAQRVEASFPRLALHAAILRLRHPITGEECEFRSEWPEDLRPGLAEAACDAALVDRADLLGYFGFFA
jgi:23S rRNA pseudouridine1911/1915/1917 synthase